jgi:DeoR/GlpR family transcriptional regulator of sugar metabolism
VTDAATVGLPERGPAARREQVRRRVLAEGFARLEDLARGFDVSLMTMHRDIDALQAEGWLIKIRGGATANPSALVEAGVRERTAAMRAEKSAITELASHLLSHGQTIFLDDSTTALGLVPYLVAHPPITVATNFLPAVEALGESPNVELHLLGGEYHRRQQACQGLQTIEAIGSLHADIFFMSTTAVSEAKCLHRSEATVMVRKAFLRNCTRSVLLVDHAKFGRPAPHVLCGIEDFDTVITDDGIDPDDLSDLRARCADVQVATVAR